MPIIRSQLKTQFPHATLHPIRPENAVAIGCAIQGAVIDNKITDLAALDVITLSLGIELVEGLFEKVVDRNTPIPTQKTACFTTTADYVTKLPICFYQGESDLVSIIRISDLQSCGAATPFGITERIRIQFH